MMRVSLKEAVEAYLADNESLVESDGFLTGLDVTLDQAKELLGDFVNYVKIAYPKGVLKIPS